MISMSKFRLVPNPEWKRYQDIIDENPEITVYEKYDRNDIIGAVFGTKEKEKLKKIIKEAYELTSALMDAYVKGKSRMGDFDINCENGKDMTIFKIRKIYN
jgi:hypothetical protein